MVIQYLHLLSEEGKSSEVIHQELRAHLRGILNEDIEFLLEENHLLNVAEGAEDVVDHPHVNILLVEPTYVDDFGLH